MTTHFVHREDPYSHWEYHQFDTGNRLRIIPERGGLISEWLCNGRDVLYFDQARFRDHTKSIRGGIPILFPICGDLPDNLLPLSNGDFFLKQHGFARDLPWQIELIEDHSGVRLGLTASQKTLAEFPFSFMLEIEICPRGNALEILIVVRNCGEESMPYSFGLHPYFKVNDLDKVRIEGLPKDCFDHMSTLEAQTGLQLERLADGVDFLTSCSSPVTLVDEVSGQKLELIHQHPMDLCVVWTNPPRDMVCLEPWTSPRNALINGDRKLILAPGQEQQLRCCLRAVD